MGRYRIITVVGTRPEVIKMAPVVRQLERQAAAFEHTLVTTGQHREMLAQTLGVFGLRPDRDLELMREGQSLADFTARSLGALARLFAELRPDAVLVQGDTTTVMTAALAAFYQGVRVGHVEAGLRSFDRRNPFPEEVNRRVAACVADLHFAPTAAARANLLREGVDDEDVFVTGNTVVDALRSVSLGQTFDDPRLGRILCRDRQLLLVTAHRRENHGPPLGSICRALRTLAGRFEGVQVIYPVHLNPNVRAVARQELEGVPGIHLVGPVSYGDLLRLMRACYLVLTDSGGMQEEAPSFHKPVLVLREVTERPEVIEAGAGKLVGTDSGRIADEVARLLNDPSAYEAMAKAENPFGDGRAAERIVSILGGRLRRPPGGKGPDRRYP
jgi:UDP-N-acetylglucosamine 2-epimerase (non-hydrolysing)